MKYESSIKYTEFTEEDIISMFPHDAESLGLALSVRALDPTIKSVVNGLKVEGLEPWPNFVAKSGNSWSLVWGYRGPDGSVFTVNKYMYASKVAEAVELNAWLQERGYSPCRELNQDENGAVVHIVGWKQEGQYTVVRPLAYPNKGNNVAYIDNGIVRYCKSLKHLTSGEKTRQDRNEAIRKQHAEWIAEAEAEKKDPPAKDPNKQNLFF